MSSTLKLDETSSVHLPHSVEYAVLQPDRDGPLPLCLLLLGAGGTRDSLSDLQPVFEEWWSAGAVAPMIVAIPTGGPDYYLEEPGGARQWDSFLADHFLPELRAGRNVSSTVIAGISGGGYGALKLAFSRPHAFAAVGAMQPMLEPALRASDVKARNRLHHAAGGPPQLIGPSRDAVLWESNNPANRACANERQIRESGLPIYLEAAGCDFLNAHDGAEFLHRVLWDLDVPHEYHVLRLADHGGPTMRPRMRAMFSWFTSLWAPPAGEAEVERAAAAWLQSGMQGKPPAGATATHAFIRFLRARFEPLRAQAATEDPATHRGYGKL
jgi:S-formylglutathione hydrolase